MKKLKSLGSKVSTPEKPDKNILETFPNPGVGIVTFTTSEFTSKCPVTGQPDFCTVEIEYYPALKCLESKSLKLYLQSYRNEKAFIEQLIKKIYKDIYSILMPIWLRITISSVPRGGIALTARCSE
jgi:7-cyano-7-deazaguanine reductase